MNEHPETVAFVGQLWVGVFGWVCLVVWFVMGWLAGGWAFGWLVVVVAPVLLVGVWNRPVFRLCGVG
jgi:hypothetical protein